MKNFPICNGNIVGVSPQHFDSMQSVSGLDMRDAIIKPKDPANIAKFCDWSSDVESCFSVAKLYRELARISRRQSDNISRTRSILPITKDLSTSLNIKRHRNSGRMFHRDKTTLTRGEREIIAGIYQNRGDFGRGTMAKKNLQMKSHQDAWYTAKNTPKITELANTSLKGLKITDRSIKDFCHLSQKSLTGSSIGADFKYLLPALSKPSAKTKQSSLLKENSVVQLEAQTYQISLLDRYKHDVAKGIQKIQSQRSSWSDNLTAPPSTPELRNCHRWNEHYPLFDKLLDRRPRFSIYSSFEPDNFQVHNASYTQLNGYKNKEQKLSHTNESNLHLKEVPVFVGWASDDLSVITLRSSKAKYGELNNINPQMNREFDDVQETALRNPHVTFNAANNNVCTDICMADGEQEEETQTSMEKKVKVQVYLPTAEIDPCDNDIAFVV